MRHLFYLWSFSAADAKYVWISGEHFHLSLRGAGSSLTESARTNFLELSFLLVCETEVVKVTGIIHMLNTALLAGKLLLSNSFMRLSAPVYQGKFATGRGFPRAGVGIKCTERELTCAWAGIQCTAPLRCHRKENVRTRSRTVRLFLPQTKQGKEQVQHIQGKNHVLGKLSMMATWQRCYHVFLLLMSGASLPYRSVGDLQTYCRRLAYPVKSVALNPFHAAVLD